MSSTPFISIDEFDGTNGVVKTKAFVNWEVDLNAHQPRQKVVLGDSEVGDVTLPCIVCTDSIDLEPGCGYYFGGVDYEWEAGEEIQLRLGDNSWATKFHDPNED